MKNINKEKYSEMVKKATPNSPVLKNSFFAFIFGGGICTLGQVLLNIYSCFGFDINESKTLVSISLIFIAAVLTAFNVFDKIGKIAGAGTLVPITGFANSMVSPAMEFKSEGFITGLGVKQLSIAGPVIVYGTVASVI